MPESLTENGVSFSFLNYFYISFIVWCIIVSNYRSSCISHVFAFSNTCCINTLRAYQRKKTEYCNWSKDNDLIKMIFAFRMKDEIFAFSFFSVLFPWVKKTLLFPSLVFWNPQSSIHSSILYILFHFTFPVPAKTHNISIVHVHICMCALAIDKIPCWINAKCITWHNV